MHISEVKKIFSKWLVDNNYVSEEINRISLIRLKSGKYTDAFRCNIGKNKPIFFLKRKKKSDDDQDYLVEYKTLNNLWKSSYKNKKNYLIPEPYGIIDEHEFLITEFVSGKKLSNYILVRAALPLNFLLKNQARKAIARTAMWISDYDKQISLTQMIRTDESVERFGLKKIKELDFIDDSQKKKLEEALINKSSLVPEKIPYHLVNTDLKVHNVLVDSKKVIVIDWEKMQEEFPIFWMASSFLRSLHDLSINWFISNSTIEELKATFIKEYSDKSSLNDSLVYFNLVQVFEILTFLAGLKSENRFTHRKKYFLYEYLKRLLDINE